MERRNACHMAVVLDVIVSGSANLHCCDMVLDMPSCGWF